MCSRVFLLVALRSLAPVGGSRGGALQIRRFLAAERMVPVVSRMVVGFLGAHVDGDLQISRRAWDHGVLPSKIWTQMVSPALFLLALGFTWRGRYYLREGAARMSAVPHGFWAIFRYFWNSSSRVWWFLMCFTLKGMHISSDCRSCEGY